MTDDGPLQLSLRRCSACTHWRRDLVSFGQGYAEAPCLKIGEFTRGGGGCGQWNKISEPAPDEGAL